MRALVVAVAAAAALGQGCSNDDCGDRNGKDAPGAIISAEGAQFTLSCSSDLTQVAVTGPCTNGPNSGLYLPVYDVEGRYVAVYSPSPGVCHVELVFSTGFTYSTDVTFTWQGQCGQHYAGPTTSAFMVDDPSDACVDGGGE